MRFKKILLIVLVSLVYLFCSSCGKEEHINDQTPTNKLTILTVNDFHGALEEEDEEFGITRLGAYIKGKKDLAPNGVIALSAGDMFQGTGLSIIKYGLDTINLMNYIGFDAMTIGNHEFDWGIEKILDYCDGSTSNGEANFPFISSNIYRKVDNTLLFAPYTIIERGGLKIGVVGYIGYGLEDDIAYDRVSDYEFRTPVSCIRNTVKMLRETKEVTVVIALGHDGSNNNNNALAMLEGNERIDAIVNGHLHLDSTNYLTRYDGNKIPVVQAGCDGEYVGLISFDVDQETKTVSNGMVRNVKMDFKQPKDEYISSYVNKIVEESAPYFNRVLNVANIFVLRSNAQVWCVDTLHKYSQNDIAIINYGGVRANAFPIKQNEEITISKMYQMIPFDNTIKSCVLLGSQIRNIVSSSDLLFSSNVVINNSVIKINDELLDDKKEYTITTINYVFDKEEYPFKNGTNIIISKELFRDVLIKELEELKNNNHKWFE